MHKDLKIIEELKRLNANEIHRVFFSIGSQDWKRMKTAINHIWHVGDEDNALIIIIISFLQYLINNNCEELNRLYLSCKKDDDIEFSTLLLAKLELYLSNRYKYKDQRHLIYDTLIDTPHSTPTVWMLKKKKELKAYLWGDDGKIYDNDIQQVVDKLNRPFDKEQLFDFRNIKEELRKALCINPEMILCSYDFSDTLDNWRMNTAKRIISQIGDILIIKHLLNHDPKVTEKVFFSYRSKYRISIDRGFRTSWKLDKEDISAVVNSFVFDLTVRKKGSKLKKLSTKIVRVVPYIQMPLSTTSRQPDKWKKYEDGNLCSLLQENACSYADERSKFKDERFELKRLSNLTPEEREINFNIGNYNVTIAKAVKNNYKKYKNLIDAEIIRNRLKFFLSDAFYATLARYDFQQELSEWLNIFTENMINDLVKLESLMSPEWRVHILEKDYRSIIQKKASLIKIGGKSFLSLYKYDTVKDYVNDILSNLFIILWDNDKKVLNDFKFDVSLDSYINSIVYHHILKEVKQVRKNTMDGHEKEELELDEEEQIADEMDKSLLKEDTSGTNEALQEFFISSKAKSILYHGLIEILKNPNHREHLGLHRKKMSKTQELQLKIYEDIHVILNDPTRKELTLVRKRLIEELNKEKYDGDEQNSSIGKKASRGEQLIRKYEQRVKELFENTIFKEIGRIRSIPPEKKLSPQEEALLNDYERVIREAIDSQLKQEPNE